MTVNTGSTRLLHTCDDAPECEACKAEQPPCARCGATDRDLDAVWHCSTCYAEAQATIERLRAQVEAVEIEIRSWEDGRFDKSGREAEWTMFMMRKFREALKGRVPSTPD